ARRVSAIARRLRLHAGVSDCEAVARRAHSANFCRHQRNHEIDHCEIVVTDAAALGLLRLRKAGFQEIATRSSPVTLLWRSLTLCRARCQGWSRAFCCTGG